MMHQPPELTDQQKWLSRKYLIYKVFTNLWFLSAVWLYFYRIFITDAQVGILDGFAFGIGLIAEVPSGALADQFGRDKMVKIGQLMFATGLLIQVFGSSFAPFFIGQSIMMIGAAFVSGADEALFFDQLKFDRNSVHWRKLVTRGTQLTVIATLCATVAGGWIHTINPRATFLLTSISFFISVAIIWNIKEIRGQKIKQSFTTKLSNYLLDIKDGFFQFRQPKLNLYIPLIVTVQGLFYIADWGLLKLVLLDRFNYSPFWGSIVLASSGIIAVGVLAYMHHSADKLSEKNVLIAVSLAAASGMLLSIANIGYWGYFVLLSIIVGENVLLPFISEILNYQTNDKQRATVLSVASFLRMLPYVVLAPIIGYLNTQGKLSYFLVTWALLIIIAVLVYLSRKKQDIQVSFVEE